MSINITKYEAICNLGDNIEDIYCRAISADTGCFVQNFDIFQDKSVRLGVISEALPEIFDTNYNLRCNQLLLKVCNSIEESIKSLIEKYGASNIGVVVATTNTGVQEYERSRNLKHTCIGNPAEFIKNHFQLSNFYTSISTACSSGIKAFSIASELIENGISKAVIVAGVDPIAKLSVYGFDSLGILSEKLSNPFSKNRNGINIGEAAAVFLVERNVNYGIEIAGIGETTDVYHATSPDPSAREAIRAIREALSQAEISPFDIDYINLHGTGSESNDLMESRAVYNVFKDKVYASSTKPLTGHCLGAAASLETALCCKLLELGTGNLYPHVYDGEYDDTLPVINLVPKDCKISDIKTCLCLSFGFGGTNAVMVLRRNYGSL